MIQAYQGYFGEDGRFVADNVSVKIPIKRRVIVNVLDDEVVETKSKAQLQNDALKMFSVAMKEITDEPLDEEFDEIVNKSILAGSAPRSRSSCGARLL